MDPAGRDISRAGTATATLETGTRAVRHNDTLTDDYRRGYPGFTHTQIDKGRLHNLPRFFRSPRGAIESALDNQVPAPEGAVIARSVTIAALSKRPYPSANSA